MNTAARAIAQGNITTTLGIRTLVFSKTLLCTASLITLILLSALGLVYVKDQGRRLVSDIAHLQQLQQMLQIKQGQILLEKRTLTAQARLETIAQNQLQMTVPTLTTIIFSR
ncbi:MAG: cell division protein FtsL [Gammaproteobacteria bacterium]|nr:cell division protein FtsL [Gammaproteobacteria bacterium]